VRWRGREDTVSARETAQRESDGGWRSGYYVRILCQDIRTLASGSSNLSRVRRQSPTRGLFMSHNSPSPLVVSVCVGVCL
jgi:hypothetical protein